MKKWHDFTYICISYVLALIQVNDNFFNAILLKCHHIHKEEIAHNGCVK